MNKFKSDHKQEVRNMIHSTFLKHGCRRILFFPASRRDELDALLGWEFRLSDLHAVEQSPQIQANFTRQLSAEEKTELAQYRAKLSDAAVDMKSRGVILDAANLDFCYTIRKATPQIVAFLKTQILAPDAVVAVQVFGGRDNLFGYGRVRAIDAAIEKGLTAGDSYERLFEHSYWNETSKAVMRYAVYSIKRG